MQSVREMLRVAQTCRQLAAAPPMTQRKQDSSLPYRAEAGPSARHSIAPASNLTPGRLEELNRQEKDVFRMPPEIPAQIPAPLARSGAIYRDLMKKHDRFTQRHL